MTFRQSCPHIRVQMLSFVIYELGLDDLKNSERNKRKQLAEVKTQIRENEKLRITGALGEAAHEKRTKTRCA